MNFFILTYFSTGCVIATASYYRKLNKLRNKELNHFQRLLFLYAPDISSLEEIQRLHPDVYQEIMRDTTTVAKRGINCMEVLTVIFTWPFEILTL